MSSKLLFKDIVEEVKPCIEAVFNKRELFLEGSNFLKTMDDFKNQICLYCKVSKDQRFWGSHEERMLVQATHLVFISYIDRLFFVVDKFILESFIQDQSSQTTRAGRPVDPLQYKYSLDIDDSNIHALILHGISNKVLVSPYKF